MTRAHTPVLAAELVASLTPRPGELAVDCTFGAGGHAALVAERVGPSGCLIGVDRDPEAARRFEAFAEQCPASSHFIAGDYAEVLPALVAEGVSADVVYFDLGLSSMQVDGRKRGFSYAYDAPLDMRMDPRQALDARELVNGWDERRLKEIFRSYGEERYAGPIARAIVRRRARQPLETTQELVETIAAAVPTPAHFAGGHPAKRVFQALRIAVNDELASLDRALPAAWALLRPGGRLAAISFHSLEDRRVKRFLADRARGCICPPDLPVCGCGRTPEAELVSRALVPSAGEVADNPRSRSGRLRAARKLLPEASS